MLDVGQDRARYIRIENNHNGLGLEDRKEFFLECICRPTACFYQPQAVSNFGVACCCSSASSSSSEDRCLQNCVILVFMGTMPHVFD